MKLKSTLFYFILFIASAGSKSALAQLKVSFPSKDGLTVVADWYPVSSEMPVILLCHQNQSSRGEYVEIALRLNKFGFNCLAIDQRVGTEVNGVKNETAENATAKGMQPVFEDTEQDIIAAIDYLYSLHEQKLILLGSSYSASLVLKISSSDARIKGVAVFSPGEYFSNKNYIKPEIEKLTKPIFISSSLAEADKVTELVQDVNSRIKIQYVPKAAGEHGAKALWTTTEGHQEYWIALMNFLDKVKNLN
ncbi:MAG: alpha/beta hydrolase [Bacteroidia bacterium]|nr:alpha/beta hydrolase [Bacteroidia bacterium]